MRYMNVIIAGIGFSMPEGTGATSRVLAIAKGLQDNGVSVKIFCIKPTEISTINVRKNKTNGTYEGVPYKYSCGRKAISKNKIGALYLYLKGLYYTYKEIKNSHKKMPVDAIILWYEERPLIVYIFNFLCKKIGAMLIAEVCELPFVYHKNTLIKKIRLWVNDKYVYKLFDGAIVISTYLYKYMSTRIRNENRIIKIPILVQTKSFKNIKKQKNSIKKIIYCGNLDNEGEVVNIIRSFSLIVHNHKDWIIEIIGPKPINSTLLHIEKVIDELMLNDYVKFEGAIRRSDIPDKLINGDIMVLPRSAGDFSDAGLPTKLGEYLATGNPTIVTNIGDIEKYLTNGLNAYIVASDDIMAFSEVMDYVIKNYSEAEKVGSLGQKVAEKYFDSSNNCKKIINYINYLKKENNYVIGDML
jgi:glycosyltransferase involved in cell wall biosynthesis